MLLGVSVSTITALVFQLNKGAFHNGIYGYNGTLVGLGISVFSFGDVTNPILFPQVIGPIVVLSIGSTIFVAGIGRLFVGKFEISPFTIPFCLCVWIWLLGASGQFGYFPVNGSMLQQHLLENPMTYVKPQMIEYGIREVIRAVPIGVA